MKLIKRLITIITTFLILAGPNQVWANDKSIGAIFLNDAMGARAGAMGEAFVGVAEDSHGVFWNPAGLVHIGDIELLIAHTEFIQDFRNEYFALNSPLSPEDALGIHGYLSYIHNLEKTLTLASSPRQFSAYDSYFGVAWSHAWTKKFSTGISGKAIYQIIDNYSAWSFAGDISFYMAHLVPDLSVGLMVKNIGLPMKFINKSSPLPLTVDLGSGYRLLDKNLLLTFDISRPIQQELMFKMGAEYTISEIIFLRAGYKYSQFGNDLGPLSGMTLGLGADIADYLLDYAFTPYADLGQVHRISLTLHFGRNQVSEEKIVQRISREMRAKQKAIIRGYLQAAQKYKKTGNYKKALFYYEKIRMLSPRHSDIALKISHVQKRLKNKNAREHFQKGLRAYTRKDYLTALIEWSKTKDIKPDFRVVDKWLKKVNRKLAFAKSNKSYNRKQSQSSYYYVKGLNHLRTGQYRRAIKAWKNHLAQNPNNSNVKKYLEIARQKMKDEINSLLAQGQDAWQQGEYAVAVKKWKKVLKKYPDNTDAAGILENKSQDIKAHAHKLYRKGIQNYINNRLLEAINNWQLVLVLDPGNAKADKHLKRAQRKIEEMELIQDK